MVLAYNTHDWNFLELIKIIQIYQQCHVANPYVTGNQGHNTPWEKEQPET